MRLRFTGTLGLLLVLHTVRSAQHDPHCVFIKELRVPQDSITVEQLHQGGYRFSGKAFYALDTDYDSARIHIYIEHIPFKRTYLRNHRSNEGHATFRNIDSLCTGDVGWVKPGEDRAVSWTYTTPCPHSHCRIKAGIGNYAYANTNTQFGTMVYNRQGLLHRTKRYTIQNSDTSFIETLTHRYTKWGQFQYDRPELGTAVYDERNRLAYDKHRGLYCASFEYDSKNRMIATNMLSLLSSPEEPGEPFNRWLYTYDEFNRMTSWSKHLVAHEFEGLNCSDFFFAGRDEWYYYYVGETAMVDTMVRFLIDTTDQVRMLVKMHKQNCYTGQVLDSTTTITRYYGDSGTCYGADKWSAGRTIYEYDQYGSKANQFDYGRTSRDSPWKVTRGTPGAVMWEYDENGNLVREYSQRGTLRYINSFDKYNHLTMRVQQGEDSDTSRYEWQLIDLDQQEDLLIYENH